MEFAIWPAFRKFCRFTPDQLPGQAGCGWLEVGCLTFAADGIRLLFFGEFSEGFRIRPPKFANTLPATVGCQAFAGLVCRFGAQVRSTGSEHRFSLAGQPEFRRVFKLMAKFR
jgi:hypothetical protein